MNNALGHQPISFLGLHPGRATRYASAASASRSGAQSDDGAIARIPHAGLGTGWDIPAGVLHAPASVCTYEPQAASDVFCMCESWSNNREVPEELLWKDIPDERKGDLEFIIELLDWERNVDPTFATDRFMTALETSGHGTLMAVPPNAGSSSAPTPSARPSSAFDPVRL